MKRKILRSALNRCSQYVMIFYNEGFFSNVDYTNIAFIDLNEGEHEKYIQGFYVQGSTSRNT